MLILAIRLAAKNEIDAPYIIFWGKNLKWNKSHETASISTKSSMLRFERTSRRILFNWKLISIPNPISRRSSQIASTQSGNPRRTLTLKRGFPNKNQISRRSNGSGFPPSDWTRPPTSWWTPPSLGTTTSSSLSSASSPASPSPSASSSSKSWPICARE